MQVQSTASTSRACQQCGRAYAKTPGRGNRTGSGAKFCSNVCRGLSMRGKVERICEPCGSAFLVNPAVIRNGGGKFCSKRCKGDAQTVRIERPCDYCGDLYRARRDTFIKGMARYCGKSCSNSGRATPLSDRVPAGLPMPIGEGCSEWTGARDRDGYGVIELPGGRTMRVHRIAWELATGEPIPTGFMVLHVCDNPPCARADGEGWYEANGILHPRRGHLWLGTNDDNMKDMAAKNRARTSVTGRLRQPSRVAPHSRP